MQQGGCVNRSVWARLYTWRGLNKNCIQNQVSYFVKLGLNMKVKLYFAGFTNARKI